MRKLIGDVLKLFGYIFGFYKYYFVSRFCLVFCYICLGRDFEEEKGQVEILDDNLDGS